MHHLTPNTWPLRQQTDLPSPSPSSSPSSHLMVFRPVPTLPREWWERKGCTSVQSLQGGRRRGEHSCTHKKERKRSEIIADIREECMKIDRKWRSRLRRLYEWTLHLVSLWSHPSFDQKASGQREGRPASKGREEGGEDDGEAVIFNSLPPVKSAGKVIRPASPPPPPPLHVSHAGCCSVVRDACC